MKKKVKVLYISHYFPPEVNAPALRVSELGKVWADQGAQVTVLTCFPNHPSGIIPPEYRGMRSLKENFGKLKVVRTYVYAAANKGFAKRIINYLSFMFSAIFLGTSKTGRQDVLIATSPQFFVAVAGFVISRLKGCRFILEIRDVWPAQIVAVGAIKNPLIIKVLEALEMFLYKKADLIVAVAQGTIDLLASRGVYPGKMALIPNGVNLENFKGAVDTETLRHDLGLTGKYVVGYVGTMGMSQKLEVVLEAARLLKDKEDIHFLFVGEGADKANLVSGAQEMGLTRVHFHQQIDHHRIPQFLKSCDLLLVPLRKVDLFTKNIPSKIYEIMAAGRPLVIGTHGESRRLVVEEAKAGLAAEPEDGGDMAAKILTFYEDPEQGRKLGENGKGWVSVHASRREFADKYLGMITDLIRE